LLGTARFTVFPLPSGTIGRCAWRESRFQFANAAGLTLGEAIAKRVYETKLLKLEQQPGTDAGADAADAASPDAGDSAIDGGSSNAATDTGAVGTGGTSSGGSSGTGSGGTSRAGSGGASPNDGAAGKSPAPPADDDDGCGCRTIGRDCRKPVAGWVALLATLLVLPLASTPNRGLRP
jgi:hypothetical protein